MPFNCYLINILWISLFLKQDTSSKIKRRQNFLNMKYILINYRGNLVIKIIVARFFGPIFTLSAT